MDALLPLANSTGGQAKKMHASELSNVFANTLAVKTVATGVEIAINLHKSLKFRNSDVKLQQNGSRMLRKFAQSLKMSPFSSNIARNQCKNYTLKALK